MRYILQTNSQPAQHGLLVVYNWFEIR